MSVDWTEVRAEFDACREQAYLDTATYGPGPRPVLEAVTRASRDWAAGRGDWRAWDAEGDRAREGFARVLGASPDHVALLPSLSAAAAQVAERVPNPGAANLVVGGNEFRSNLFPWLVQERRGFEVRVVEPTGGRVTVADFARAVDGRTALVAASSVQSSNGHRIALSELAELCRAHDSRLFVDGTQSVGALRFPLELADYVGVAAYKWLLAPRGPSFLWAREEHVDELLPLAPGWRSPDDPHASYYGAPLELAPRASKLDVSLAWLPWVGAAPAIDFVGSIGVDAIEPRVLALAGRFRAGLARLGLEPLFPEAESSQIVGLRVPDPDGLRERLRARSVAAAVRGAYLRVSFHFFNDEADVDRALSALDRST